jgi:hypothetical protein
MKSTVEDFEKAAKHLVHSTRTPAPVFRTRLRVKSVLVAPLPGGNTARFIPIERVWATLHSSEPEYAKKVCREALQRVGVQP